MGNSLEGKVITIIGASKGIGEGMAQAVAQESPKGLVLAARSVERINELAKHLNFKYKVDCLAIPTDVTSSDSLRNLVAETVERYGAIDVVFNSAGIIQKETPIEEMGPDRIDSIISTNLSQVIKVGSLITPHFLEQGSGNYIVISSQAGLEQVAFPNEETYNASKAGVNHFVRTLNARFKPLREQGQELYVYSLAPGFIKTPEARRQFPDVLEKVWEKAPSPEEFAESLIPYLTNPKEQYQNEPVKYLKTARSD
tara:strand:- start:6390 stop:7154 length:765 start_codon:yes stop_codon:yes gene_type:complete